MWIALNEGFLSAVADRHNPEYLLVRARNEEHLRTYFPSHPILRFPHTDYIARVRVTRREFADFLANHAMNINYTNFKDSVKDPDLHDMYADIWEVGYHYQNRNRSSKSRRRSA